MYNLMISPQECNFWTDELAYDTERMPIQKIWDHVIDMKEGFVLRKGKMYLLSREEREEVYEFINE